MRVPLVGRFQHVPLKRSFRRSNPDIRRVYSAGEAHAKKNRDTPSPLSKSDLDHWDDSGFLILRGFFSPSVLDEYKRHVDDTWQQRHQAASPLVIFTRRGKHHLRDAVDEDRVESYRLQDQYLIDGATRNLVMHPRLSAILHQLMGHAPVVCNTLLFEWGSEQDMHSDMFYMAPASENQMLATWIAVDDATEDNGPLVFVPGSHKLPPHRFSDGRVQAITEETAGAVAAMEEKMSAAGLEASHFLATRGDVLIWHSQLMHGGSAIRDRSARRTSLVTHYFSTRDLPTGKWLCAERDDGSLLMVKNHLPVP